MHSLRCRGFFRLSPKLCVIGLRRSISSQQFNRLGHCSPKVLINNRWRHDSQFSWQCGANLPFLTSVNCFHSAHKERSIVDLLENGEKILPSDLGLCTYTPRGAYTYLLETLHESLNIDWQLSIILSSVLIRLAIIPIKVLVKKVQKRRTFALTTMTNSFLLTREKSPKSEDLEKLKNGIWNNCLKHGVLFLFCQYFAEALREAIGVTDYWSDFSTSAWPVFLIVAFCVFAGSINSIVSLLGCDYLTGSISKTIWVVFTLPALWIAANPTFHNFIGSSTYHKLYTILSFIYLMSFALLFPMPYQYFLIPMVLTSYVLKRVKLK